MKPEYACLIMLDMWEFISFWNQDQKWFLHSGSTFKVQNHWLFIGTTKWLLMKHQVKIRNWKLSMNNVEASQSGFSARCMQSHGGALCFSGNARHNESNIWHDGQMHISCPQRRCSQTTRGNVFPGRNANKSQTGV